jgi:CheY-like chemotaxis protein
MVYSFVRRSGGHTKIYSEPGQGTTVHLYLPRAASGAAGKDRPETDGASLPHGDETVLVVDDEEGLLDAAVKVLTALGYRTLTAANGPEALAILKAVPSIDLLFSDVIMPGSMDGYHLAIAALKDRPGLKILLTSGFTRRREEFVNGDRKIAAELAKDLLPKPYNIAELAQAVRRVLDRAATSAG